MQAQPFNQTAKELVKAEPGKVRRLVVPERKFLAISGSALPGSPEYVAAIQELFGLAYTIKFLPKRGVTPPGYTPYSVGSLEGLYDLPAPDWRWTLMLAQPEFVTETTLDHARAELRRYHKPESLHVNLMEWFEGDSVQTLHIGPYGEVGPAVELLRDYLTEQDLRAGRHHEIYLNDPRKVGEDKAKTIVRFAVTT